MRAFEAAIRLGADAVELDIQLTRDGVPVVYHDRTLGKLCGSRRRIGDLSLEELRGFDYSQRRGAHYRGVGVPALEEVLDTFGGRMPLMLEIKADTERPGSRRWHGLIDAVLESVGTRGLASNVFILSFHADVLAAVHERAPALRCVRNVDVRVRWSPGVWRSLQAVHALCLPARLATAELGQRLHEGERRLWVYRCDTERALARARRSGAETFITDDPAWLRERLRATEPSR